MTALTLSVNGVEVTRDVEPRTHLADFVRENLNLTGTHIGCEHGVCGACTMIVDGRPVRSCLSYAVSCAGADVRTLESFDNDPVVGLLRDAFSRHHALQCGYCTPGMLATAFDIVTRLPEADETRIREELSGNLCRCTGYVGIVAAIRDVLARGPHARTVEPVARGVSPRAVSGWTDATKVAAGDAATATFAVPVPERIDGGQTLSRSIPVPVSVERLWATLQDIETIARCLPGASIERINPDGSVEGAFAVAIGPMKARFAGTAQVAYDASSRSGTVRGAGGDGISRSRADGAIRFAAVAAGDDASRLDIDMTYKLSGPLAQFGRPVVVAHVVDRMLGEVAANLARVSEGGVATASAPIGGIGFVLGTVLAMLRQLLIKDGK
ncbi:MAG: 2Fe-2S iron-sulfur cluster binding domain-containing protein [Rhodopseudomonas sp.]|nr:2Fe-2S iron-sulfur cluster binding domain-containing protein [Rhodopseudomonas sp.]